MASAAGPASSSLLLRYLTLTGWAVDVQRGTDGAYSGLAERSDARLAAWARTRTAAAILLFEHACSPPRHG